MRSPVPQIPNQEICKNANLSLQAQNIDEITVYADSLMHTKLFTGSDFIVEGIARDTVFYIRNEAGQYPSKLVKVEISIIPIAAKMEVRLDLNSVTEEFNGIALSTSEYAESLVWIMGNDTLGTQNEIYFNLDDLYAKQLKLLAISEFGCIDSTFLETTKSELPEFEDYYLCQSQSVSISALNTGAVYYFADENLNEYIGKGANVTISEVSEDFSIYAVNVENIEPSDIVEVPIFVSNLSSDFNLSHDTLNLAFEQNLILEALSESATAWSWFLDGNRIGDNQNLQYEMSEAGVFTIALLVSDSLGCSAESEQEIVVFNDPLLGTRNELKSYFSVFPNPADKRIHLTGKGQFNYDSYSIIDPKGKEILNGKNDKPVIQSEIIDVSGLNDGPYYLIIRKGKQEASFLFIINR
jgi:hypothetical protein